MLHPLQNLKVERENAVVRTIDETIPFEAYAIVKPIQAQKQYLQGRYFKLITDQRSVAFMYKSYSSKIKHDKFMRWSWRFIIK